MTKLAIKGTSIRTILASEGFYVSVASKEEFDKLIELYMEAGFDMTSSSRELEYKPVDGAYLVKYAKCLGYIWSSSYGPYHTTLTFKGFVEKHCVGVYEAAKAETKPKLFDKQVLELAELIRSQEALVAQLKDNGNKIKELKARMGVE